MTTTQSVEVKIDLYKAEGAMIDIFAETGPLADADFFQAAATLVLGLIRLHATMYKREMSAEEEVQFIETILSNISLLIAPLTSKDQVH